MRRLPAVIALLLVLVGCASMDGDPASPVEGMRVAYVVNMANSDIFTEAAAGAVETANVLGMDCSVFFSGGDDEAFASIIEELAEMDYDGFLLSHGGREYTYGLISSILSEHPDIRFVTFDTELIGPNGEAEGIDGVTQFFQNDRHLASILLDYILSDVVDEEPARIIKVWVPDYIVAFDRRNEGYMEYEEAGRIITAATGTILGFSNVFKIMATRLQLRSYNGFFNLLAVATLIFMVVDVANVNTYIVTLNCCVAIQIAHFFSIHKFTRRYMLFFSLQLLYLACTTADLLKPLLTQ